MTVECKEVRMKPSHYYPTIAEVEEVFEPRRKADELTYTVNEVARTLLRPVMGVEDLDA